MRCPMLLAQPATTASNGAVPWSGACVQAAARFMFKNLFYKIHLSRVPTSLLWGSHFELGDYGGLLSYSTMTLFTCLKMSRYGATEY